MLGLRWIAMKFAMFLPEPILNLLQIKPVMSEGSRCCDDTSNSDKQTTCCPTSEPAPKQRRSKFKQQKSLSPQTTKIQPPQTIESIEHWESLLKSNKENNTHIVAKFTAEWCKPCKQIDPYFSNMNSKYDATFAKLDVDLLDELASKYSVAMMPTFLIFYGDEKITEDCKGADQCRLENFVRSHVRTRE